MANQWLIIQGEISLYQLGHNFPFFSFKMKVDQSSIKKSKWIIIDKLLLSFILLSYFRWGYVYTAKLNKFCLIPIELDIFIDNIIPLVPFFIIFYFIGYIFVFAPIFIIKQRKECYLLAFTYFLILSFSFYVFRAIPIVMYKQFAYGEDIFSKFTYLQQRIDTCFNNFPSLHVSQNLFAFLFIRDRHKVLGKYLLPIVILIICSTLFVKQHLFVDVLGGILLAFISFKLFYYFDNRFFY